MGWTYSHRDKGITNEEFFLKCFNEGTRFHAHGTVGGVFYAAIETPSNPGEVWGYIALTNWVPADHFNFGYKDMSESMGPYEYRAPLAVLNALTPTDNPTSLEWRERATQHHEQRKALRGMKEGDQIVLSSPLRFTDGSERDTFTVRRTPIRGGRTKVRLTDEWGHGYRVNNWQDMTEAIIRNGERIETPLALKREENRYVRAVDALQMSGSDEVREALKERYGGKGYSDLTWAARQEFRRGDLFSLAVA